ncbi:hypothetical protein ACJ6WD_09505 [Streptomyces sp. VTCC 41912]|uniref:hypothetical protein n=1 Tax=Streptomyces TaxID=1883 RepID=UPI002F264FA1
MQPMTRDELVAVLDDIRDRVASGDSCEGKLAFLLGEDADRPYQVTAVYRTGQLLGQGSTVLVGVDLDIPGAAA